MNRDDWELAAVLAAMCIVCITIAGMTLWVLWGLFA